MNKKTFFFGLLIPLVIVGGIFKVIDTKNTDINKLRSQHIEFLKNHPFQKIGKLPKKERKAQGLPPNAFFEQKYLSEINPTTGRTHQENILKLQKKLNRSKRAPGEVDNNWVERGPDNVGGRTRALIFDPNDTTNETVFAGGVSGGLWKNTKISDPANKWVRVGIPENLAVSCIAVDPNNSKIFYVGTGESYVNGDANGDGLWKTVDGGSTWAKIFGGATENGTTNSTIVSGIQHINDLIVRNNSGKSEVYIAAGESGYIGGVSLGGDSFGVYRSVDGINFSQLNIPKTAAGNEHEPNNLEIASDNSIYLSTTRSQRFYDGGGVIFKSTNGTTFNKVYTITDGVRTEIAVSPTSPNMVYVLAQTRTSGAPVKMFKTEDNFTNVTRLSLPNDADANIAASDFTRGQTFYDLLLRIDPNNENTLYVGGIDLFKTTDGGANWNQLSHWYGGFGFQNVHADQHGLAFASSNRMVFSNDGGVYFTNNSGTNISARNKNYNTLQFYTVGVAPTTAFNGAEYFIAGAQDNGTQLIREATTGINSSIRASGGDGAASFFDTDGTDKYYITNYVYNQSVSIYNYATNSAIEVNEEGTSNGDFINQEELDSNLNILYSNYSSGGNYIVKRYSSLLGAIAKKNLTNALMNSAPSTLKISPYTTTSSKLYLGLKNGKLLKVENANTNAESWSEITGSSFIGSISDIEFGKNENQIFVTMHNYGVVSVWYSSDEGVTWVNKEGDLPDIPVKSIIQNPYDENEIIIGTDLGVWKTSNFNTSSPTWKRSDNGMSNVPVLDLDLRDDNVVFAATYGRGIFSGSFLNLSEDADGDGVNNDTDNCPTTANADQADVDGNGIGDLCQDTDGDGVLDINDNCVNKINPGQKDRDGNGVGDVCQDTDGDGIMDDKDNCPRVSNADQKDTDGDGVGDVCQDGDNDGVIDSIDNCLTTPNTDQKDSDGNGVGDACQDTDGDGIMDNVDNCIDVKNADQKDTNGNGIGDICDSSYLTVDNISIQTISETCVGENDGEITVNIKETFVSYIVTLKGDEKDEVKQLTTASLTFENLKPASYEICIKVNDKNYTQCFEINIKKASTVSLKVAKNQQSKDYTINVNSGTAPYNVYLNGSLINTFNESTFNVKIAKSGVLEVKTAKSCEGVFKKMIGNIFLKRNPVGNTIDLLVPSDINSNVGIKVFDVAGNLFYKKQFKSKEMSYLFRLEDLIPGFTY